MSGDKFPVMHGSMFIEPDSLEVCESIECKDCAYNASRVEFKEIMNVDFCAHYDVLVYIEGVKT